MMKLENILIANFLFLILAIENSAAQDMHKVDSLKALLETVKEDTQKVILLNSISWEINNTLPDSAFEYASKALKLSEKLYYKQGLALSKNNMGFIYYHKGNYEEALNYYKEGLSLYKEISNKKGILRSLLNIGFLYEDQGNYNKALELYFECLKISEELGDKKGVSSSYMNIGIIHANKSDFEKALEFFNKSLKIQEEINDKKQIADLFNNIAIIHYNRVDYNKSLEFHYKSLKIREEIMDKYGMAMSYNNIGNIYTNKDDPDKSLDFYLKSLKIREEIKDQFGIATTYQNIGVTYLLKNDIDQALNNLNKALSLSKVSNLKQRIYETYKLLSEAYSKSHDYKKAHEYYKLYTAVKDSIFNETSTKAIAEIQTKYETEKKEKEIEILTKDNDLKALQAKQQDDQIKKQWLLIIGIVFILGLAFSLMYVIYSQFKFKKAANEELELKNRTVEEINKELDKKNKSVVESINYAQRIQETIMPTQNQLQKLFPESFIFYKVKDVVSGDFPWVWSSNGNKENIFVSAVDCTGHGVPGAMMSMIGYFLLNEIVNDRKIQMPSEILNQLHKGIKQTLRQDENMESKDGMDIALCNIRKNQMEVQFSGAHRPMLWLHKEEIIEVKGNRFPIGGVQYSSRGKEIKFTNHILKLEKGDSIYFYSDGLVDQLSSESGKRFKNNQVKKIILENQNKPMQEIHDIMDKEFIKWMGNEKQLDDVLMVGIRM